MQGTVVTMLPFAELGQDKGPMLIPHLRISCWLILATTITIRPEVRSGERRQMRAERDHNWPQVNRVGKGESVEHSICEGSDQGRGQTLNSIFVHRYKLVRVDVDHVLGGGLEAHKAAGQRGGLRDRIGWLEYAQVFVVSALVQIVEE